ncbi:hypothetical protein KAH55_14715, partial [bacterium]|nr:hypothetical protein [bacterium]
MRKLYLILFFCIPSFLLATTLNVPVVQNAAGTTLDLPIRIADSAGLYVFQYQFNFTFDPDVVTVTGVHIEKSLSENWSAPSVTISGGLCSISAAGNQPLSANGILVYIRLAVRSVAPVGSVSLLQIPFAQLNNGAIEPEINSGSLQVIADGQPPEFATAPRIISVTSTSVKIFWETNEPAIADIIYGINKTFSDVFNLNDFQIRQEIELKGLQPGQNYFFRVEIRDKAGNGPVSSLDYRFETDALYFKLNSVKGMPGSQIEIPLEISDVTGLGIFQLSGQLKYDTSLLAIRQLSTAGCVSAAWRMPRYSLKNSVLDFSLENSTELDAGGTLLRLVFDILDSAQLGMVIPITWQNAALNSGDVNISALPGEIEVSDIRAPELVSSIEVLNLSANSAVLTWQTDEAAQGLIRYGTSPATLSNEQSAAAYVSKQWFPLIGLAPNQNYWFQLVLTDVAGNAADISEVQQFTTLPAEKVHVKLANGDVNPGEKLRIALSLQNPDSARIISYSTAIQFDSERLTVIDVV